MYYDFTLFYKLFIGISIASFRFLELDLRRTCKIKYNLYQITFFEKGQVRKFWFCFIIVKEHCKHNFSPNNKQCITKTDSKGTCINICRQTSMCEWLFYIEYRLKFSVFLKKNILFYKPSNRIICCKCLYIFRCTLLLFIFFDKLETQPKFW